MSHQDWNTVTFNKPKPVATTTSTSTVQVNHTQAKIRLDAEGNEISNIKYGIRFSLIQNFLINNMMVNLMILNR